MLRLAPWFGRRMPWLEQMSCYGGAVCDCRLCFGLEGGGETLRFWSASQLTHKHTDQGSFRFSSGLGVTTSRAQSRGCLLLFEIEVCAASLELSESVFFCFFRLPVLPCCFAKATCFVRFCSHLGFRLNQFEWQKCVHKRLQQNPACKSAKIIVYVLMQVCRFAISRCVNAMWSQSS